MVIEKLTIIVSLLNFLLNPYQIKYRFFVIVFLNIKFVYPVNMLEQFFSKDI